MHTCIIHVTGANPGLVSHFVKRAMLNIARDTGVELAKKPTTKAEWGALAKQLNIETIHIAERDTQVCHGTGCKYIFTPEYYFLGKKDFYFFLDFLKSINCSFQSFLFWRRDKPNISSPQH